VTSGLRENLLKWQTCMSEDQSSSLCLPCLQGSWAKPACMGNPVSGERGPLWALGSAQFQDKLQFCSTLLPPAGLFFPHRLSIRSQGAGSGRRRKRAPNKNHNVQMRAGSGAGELHREEHWVPDPDSALHNPLPVADYFIVLC
jgi:hypothetical protein